LFAGFLDAGRLRLPFFYFTKSIVLKLKILGKTIAILLLPTFLASSVLREAFSAPLPCDVGYEWIVYHYAAVIHRESRGEGEKGMIATLSALRNGASGYKVGRLDPEIVELVAREMKMPVTHGHRHWIRIELATDVRQIKKTMKAIKSGRAVKVANQWFY
jgi:hypothetical protein